jgi:hypothetical protein
MPFVEELFYSRFCPAIANGYLFGQVFPSAGTMVLLDKAFQTEKTRTCQAG